MLYRRRISFHKGSFGEELTHESGRGGTLGKCGKESLSSAWQGAVDFLRPGAHTNASPQELHRARNGMKKVAGQNNSRRGRPAQRDRTFGSAPRLSADSAIGTDEEIAPWSRGYPGAVAPWRWS